MGYKPNYSKAAEKYLDSQVKATKRRIMDAIDKLPAGDVRRMAGRIGYRLTIGGFRVLFMYTDRVTEDGKTIIDIAHIGPRGDVYK